MESSDFLELIEFETEEIKHLFKKASIEGKGTAQEVSDRREIAVKKFLERYFPFPYRIAKGNIIDSHGERSNSIDCLILNPCHPFTVTDEDKYSVIFADGVDVAIEVKPNLANKNELTRSLLQIQSVKKLRRVKHGLVNLPSKKLTAENIKTGRQIPSIIFADKTFANIETLLTKVSRFYIDNKVPVREQVDMIVINGEGIVFNSRKDMNISFSDTHQGLFYIEYKLKTLAVFLLYMNRFPQCEMRIGEPVLNHYFKGEATNAKQIPALNKELIEKT